MRGRKADELLKSIEARQGRCPESRKGLSFLFDISTSNEYHLSDKWLSLMCLGANALRAPPAEFFSADLTVPVSPTQTFFLTLNSTVRKKTENQYFKELYFTDYDADSFIIERRASNRE